MLAVTACCRRAPGALIFAASAILFARNIGRDPGYASEFLPATLLTGSGRPDHAAFGSAAVAELPRIRFATGGATDPR